MLCLVGLITSHHKYGIWYDQLIEDANTMTAKRDSVFHLKYKYPQGIQLHTKNLNARSEHTLNQKSCVQVDALLNKL